MIFIIFLIASLKGEEAVDLINPGPFLTESDRLVEHIISECVNKLSRKHHLFPIMTTGSLPGGIVKEIGAGFEVRKILTKDQAREIIVSCVEEFLNAVNTNEELKPYLKEYPFEPKNIYVMLCIYDKKTKPVYHPFIGTASSLKGNIYYRTDDPDKKNQYKAEYEESFEEALRLVETGEH